MRSLITLLFIAVIGAVAVCVTTASVPPPEVTPEPVLPIVGKWQVIEVGGQHARPLIDPISEYMSNGRFIDEINTPKHGHVFRTGTYKLIDNILYIQRENGGTPCYRLSWELSFVSNDQCLMKSRELQINGSVLTKIATRIPPR